MSVPVLFAFLCVWWKININLTYCSRLLPYVKLNVEKQLSSPKLKQSERQFRKLQLLTWHLIKDLPSIWGCILSFWKVQWGSELLCWGTEIGRGEDQEVEGGLVQDWDWRHTDLSVTAPLPTGSEYSLELDLAHPVVPAQSGYKVKLASYLYSQPSVIIWSYNGFTSFLADFS